MAHVWEKYAGHSGTDGDEDTHSVIWGAEGYSTSSAALAAVASAAASSISGIPLRELRYDEEESHGGIWEITAEYGRKGDRPEIEENEFDFEFNFQMPSGHFDRSLETIATYGESSVSVVTATGTVSTSFPAEDFGGLINVTREGGDMRVNGVDIPSPPEVFNLRYVLPNASVSGTYLAALYELCNAPVNDDAVALTVPGVTGTLNFAKGELLLTRCSGSRRNDATWEFNFGVAYAPNLTSIPVGNITVSAKEGWQYLWAYYESVADNASTSKNSVARPVSAYVERIFDYGDFTLLGPFA